MLIATTAASAWVSLLQIDRTARHWTEVVTEVVIDRSYSTYVWWTSPEVLRARQQTVRSIVNLAKIVWAIAVWIGLLISEWADREVQKHLPMEPIAIAEDAIECAAQSNKVEAVIEAPQEIEGTGTMPIEATQSIAEPIVPSVFTQIENQAIKEELQSAIESHPTAVRRIAKKRSRGNQFYSPDRTTATIAV